MYSKSPHSMVYILFSLVAALHREKMLLTGTQKKGGGYGCCHGPQYELHCMRNIRQRYTLVHVELETTVGIDVPVE